MRLFNPISKITLLFAATLFFHVTMAQTSNKDFIRNTPTTVNNHILAQADSIKAVYEKQGFSVVRQAAINMESEYEMPVIMSLTEGSWYQFVFIGDETSSLNEVRMYDWDEKQVVYQRKYGYSEGNIISYSYIPKVSEYHMLKPVQVNNKKKKELMGYVMMFKKNS